MAPSSPTLQSWSSAEGRLSVQELVCSGEVRTFPELGDIILAACQVGSTWDTDMIKEWWKGLGRRQNCEPRNPLKVRSVLRRHECEEGRVLGRR